MRQLLKRWTPARGGLAGAYVAVLLVAGSPPTAADDPAREVYITREAAAASPDFALQGEYAKPGLGLQVIALGDGKFTAVIHKGGLPGAGWDGSERQSLDEDADGVRNLVESLELTRVERQSPTLGLAPPPGAVVLFDGSAESLAQHWQPGARRTEDGLLMQGATSTDRFRDYTLHLEFLTPFMPRARGQGRGNSGVYHQGRYETQVLDSFGLAGKNNEAGGLYSIRDPDLNMCLPPLSWQTYDVDYTAARFDAQGTRLAAPRITVRLNGVVVHRDVELPHATTAAPQGESAEAGPIFLQDHGNPVRYRNIWVLPRDTARESLRPIVAGFERFHAAPGSDAVAGGRLLLGELACTKCHAAAPELSEVLLVKEPPILSGVGNRLQAEWMLPFLINPQQTKPGTTMPALLAGLPEEDRAAAARAIVNFLVSTGTLSHAAPEAAAAQRGAVLFHRVGCVQCHEPRDNKHTVATGSSVPLVDLGRKYTVPSLTEFLMNPHQVRPSGRMPGWGLPDKELQDLAAYLIGEVEFKPLNPNLKVAVYDGAWQELPDFDQLTPAWTGEAAGLDVNAFGRSDHYGLRFDGFLPIEKRGTYKFHLGSDDGSRLLIDGAEIIHHGGIHAHSVKSGDARLEPGMHAVRIEWFEQAGEQSLTLEYEGKDLVRQDVSRRLQMTPEGNPPIPTPTGDAADANVFVFDATQVERGRELFTQIGCAACHELKVGEERLTTRLAAPPLDKCRPTLGCLAAMTPAAERPAASTATTPTSTAIPDYLLSPAQTLALQASLAAAVEEADRRPSARIEHTLQAFNCYACHSRGGLGGAAPDRNELFLTTIPEMGDEGRLPPPLDGVGDKLTDGFLKEVLRNGASDRPYMQTRMPKFGGSVQHLATAFAVVDRREEAHPATFDEPLHRVKGVGRQLVGDKGLACIKCHTLGQHKATGIQAIGLDTMHRRLREDWFLRYLFDPNAYRPGTRMPSGFPQGQATIRDVYDGDPNKQITAIWEYLQDGSRAGIPDGLLAEMIELRPTTEPILYRNFIEGLSPRGLAVGYPEKCHLAWDVNRMCLGLVWHGRFIDASKHWVGRGPGFQSPLGDHILRIEETVPLAVLASRDAPWPTSLPRDSGYQFRGYRLDAQRRPVFRYDGPGFQVEDQPLPVARGDDGYFLRKLNVTAAAGTEGLYFRAARATTVEPAPAGGWKIDGAWTLRIRGGGEPFVRESAGRKELLVPLPPGTGTVELEQEIDW